MATAWAGVVVLAAAMASLSAAAETCRRRSSSSSSSSSEVSAQQELRKKLLCNYDPQADPGLPNGQKVLLDLIMQPTLMEVYELDSSMVLQGIFVLSWFDGRLQWNPSEHHNVSRVYMEAHEIWTPTIVSYESPNRLIRGSQVRSNGSVLLSLLDPLTAACYSEPSHWPYDNMNCNVSVSNLDKNAAVLKKIPMIICDTTRCLPLRSSDKSWRQTQWSTAVRFTGAPVGSADVMVISMNLTRTLTVDELGTVLPVALVAGLLAVSTWAPADTPHRPLLLGAVILMQVLQCVMVPMRIFVAPTVPPGVVLFLRDATLLSGATFLEWLFSRWLLTGWSPAVQPPWLFTPLAILADSLAAPGLARVAGVLGLPGGNEARPVRMAALVDRVFGVVLAVVLATLSARLLPLPSV